MTPQPAQQPEVAPVPGRKVAPSSKLLIDEFLPRCDFAVVHAGVFRVPSEACYRAARALCDDLGDSAPPSFLRGTPVAARSHPRKDANVDMSQTKGER